VNTNQLQALHANVWAFRHEMTDVWPTPPPIDALAFAVTEAGETIDAELRTRGGYARNNVKDPDFYGEMADWALMLLTALGPDCDIDHWSVQVPSVLPDMNYETAFVYWYLASNGLLDVSRVVGIVHAVAAYPGMDLPAELDRRMARIRAKHGRTEA
jgi:hypothetical protein